MDLVDPRRSDRPGQRSPGLGVCPHVQVAHSASPGRVDHPLEREGGIINNNANKREKTGKGKIGAQTGHRPPLLLGLTPHLIQDVLGVPKETQIRAPFPWHFPKRKLG